MKECLQTIMETESSVRVVFQVVRCVLLACQAPGAKSLFTHERLLPLLPKLSPALASPLQHVREGALHTLAMFPALLHTSSSAQEQKEPSSNGAETKSKKKKKKKKRQKDKHRRGGDGRHSVNLSVYVGECKVCVIMPELSVCCDPPFWCCQLVELMLEISSKAASRVYGQDKPVSLLISRLELMMLSGTVPEPYLAIIPFFSLGRFV